MFRDCWPFTHVYVHALYRMPCMLQEACLGNCATAGNCQGPHFPTFESLMDDSNHADMYPWVETKFNHNFTQNTQAQKQSSTDSPNQILITQIYDFTHFQNLEY